MTVAKLAVEGYANRMARSHDALCEMDGLLRDIREQEVPDRPYTFIQTPCYLR